MACTRRSNLVAGAITCLLQSSLQNGIQSAGMLLRLSCTHADRPRLVGLYNQVYEKHGLDVVVTPMTAVPAPLIRCRPVSQAILGISSSSVSSCSQKGLALAPDSCKLACRWTLPTAALQTVRHCQQHCSQSHLQTCNAPATPFLRSLHGSWPTRKPVAFQFPGPPQPACAVPTTHCTVFDGLLLQLSGALHAVQRPLRLGHRPSAVDLGHGA